MAAFTLLGGQIFQMSHKTAVLPLNQAVAFLNQEELYASVSRTGVVYASIYDYVFRNGTDPVIAKMNFWDFVGSQEVVKLHKLKKSEGNIF